VVLGMPGYGKQTAAAGRSLWRASRDMSGVAVEYSAGSLLACNFNKLWCTALNMVHAGERVDYFAMLHDDIGCEDFWLDKLIAELEEKQLDVLGVVVPIKDTRGVTSIALHHEGDNWNPECRLTMRDVYQLPETFTSADVGGFPLLLNTGCWVVKWNQEWCRKVHFTINDRIIFDRGCNMYRPEVETYNGGIYQKIKEALPEYNFIETNSHTYSREQVLEMYKKSFIGLRFTEHDGLSNTVCEMGLMGRRMIHNGDTPNCIPYEKNNINDIIESIKHEYWHAKNPMGDNLEANGVSVFMQKYLNINEDFLNSSYYD